MAGRSEYAALLAYDARHRTRRCETIPENRVYVSPERATAFVHSFLEFSHGKVVSDDRRRRASRSGGRPTTIAGSGFRSTFGKLTVLVTDGHLPYPYGREMTGYEVGEPGGDLGKAKDAGVAVLAAPITADKRNAAMVQFPGGYIAEIHSSDSGK